MKKVAIIDFKLGNIFSVVQACQEIGLDVNVTSDYKKIMASDGVILPGVGAFGDAMSNLSKQDLIEPIRDFVSTGKPFMGVCLGLQLLFSESQEFGSHKGLDLIEGTVVKFNKDNMKVPQIGWNQIYNSKRGWEETPLENISNNEFMYFVHSYYVKPNKEENILTKTNYSGLEYCSSIQKDNIFATQFHPEKSGEKGLQIYRNWSKNL